MVDAVNYVFLSLSRLCRTGSGRLLLSVPVPPHDVLFYEVLPLCTRGLLFYTLMRIPTFTTCTAGTSISTSLMMDRVIVLLLIPLLDLDISYILN